MSDDKERYIVTRQQKLSKHIVAKEENNVFENLFVNYRLELRVIERKARVRVQVETAIKPSACAHHIVAFGARPARQPVCVNVK